MKQANPQAKSLHRAILSKTPILVALFLDEALNPSNDLLKQLLVSDQSGLTPIDFIGQIIGKTDSVDCSRRIDTVYRALVRYQNNPRFGLSEHMIQTVHETVQKIKAKIDSSGETFLYEGMEFKIPNLA